MKLDGNYKPRVAVEYFMKRIGSVILAFASGIACAQSGFEQGLLKAKVQDCELSRRAYMGYSELYSNCINPAVLEYLREVNAQASLIQESEAFLLGQASRLDESDLTIRDNAQAVNAYFKDINVTLGWVTQVELLSTEDLFQSEDANPDTLPALSSTQLGSQNNEEQDVLPLGDVENTPSDYESNLIFDPVNFTAVDHAQYRRERTPLPNDASLSVFVMQPHIHHINPVSLKHYPSPDGPFLNFANNLGLVDAIRQRIERDIREWAFLHDFNLSGILSEADVDNHAILELEAFLHDMKSGRVLKNMRFDFDKATVSSINTVSSDYLLLIDVDHLSIERWIFENISNYDFFYTSAQDLPSATVAGNFARSVMPLAGGGLGALATALLAGPVAGIIDDSQNEKLVFHHRNIISAYLVRTADAKIAWAARAPHISQLSEDARINVSTFLSDSKPFGR